MSKNETLHSINEIKNMLERSSRFISLSGKSGIAAGCVALISACFAKITLDKYYFNWIERGYYDISNYIELRNHLLLQALITLALASSLAFYFTHQNTKKNKQSIFDKTSKRLTINILIPLVTGGLFILALIQNGVLNLVSPACLIFYGLGLINGSKYTHNEIRTLGIINILLGLINIIFYQYSLFIWALGFGVSHIVYGIIMYKKYDQDINN